MTLYSIFSNKEINDLVMVVV